jgi:catechol 2,3-dioxygenase-like lactoylglutathione lyase family enzyme
MRDTEEEREGTRERGSEALDLGLTHVALPITNPAASVDFYTRYAGMRVVHERRDPSDGRSVVWLSDGTRPFVIVLIESERVASPLLPLAHLGVACASRADVDRLAAQARDEGRAVWGPTDSPPPVGYWALIADPDAHTLELSHGQEVALAVAAR